jgi:Ca-activated chloride channel homolog
VTPLELLPVGAPGVPWLAAAAAAALVLALRLAAMRRARNDLQRIGDLPVLDRVSPPASSVGRVARAALLAVGAAALAVALTGGDRGAAAPRSGGHPQLDLVLVLDASNSMLARDVAPSRLERQRMLARRLIAEVDARFAVVYFAGSGYVLSPLSDDRDATLMFVETVDPALVGRGGTAIASGLRQGLAVLAGSGGKSPGALLLLSDGESTRADDDLDAALMAAAGLRTPVHAIGIGATEGARIPLPESGPLEALGDAPAGARTDGRADGPWLRDAQGAPVVSRLEEASLRRIASETGGVFVSGTEAGIDALVRRLPGAEAPDAARAGLLLLVAFLALFGEAYLFRRA